MGRWRQETPRATASHACSSVCDFYDWSHYTAQADLEFISPCHSQGLGHRNVIPVGFFLSFKVRV